MKKVFFSLVFVFATTLLLSSCSDDFDYPMENLYGNWDATYVEIDGKWVDVLDVPCDICGVCDIDYYLTDAYKSCASVSINFEKDGYCHAGFFKHLTVGGLGKYRYKTKGKEVIAYVEPLGTEYDNKEFARFIFNSISSDNADFVIKQGKTKLHIRAKKTDGIHNPSDY